MAVSTLTGWSEDAEYDRSGEDESPAEKKNPDFFVDPQGGMQRKSAVFDKLEHFGVDTTDLNL